MILLKMAFTGSSTSILLLKFMERSIFLPVSLFLAYSSYLERKISGFAILNP